MGPDAPLPVDPTDADPLATPGPWALEVDRRLADAALAFGPDGDGFAAVRPDGARVRVDARGTSFAVGGDAFTLGATLVGRASLRAPRAAAPRLDTCAADLETPTGACVRSVAIDAPGLTTWWTPLRQGLAQSWRIPTAPGDADDGEPLTLGVPVAGAEVVQAGDDVHLLAGDTVVQVAGLDAWDADGNALTAWFEVVDDGFLIRVDDTDATYPVDVDPVYQILDWSVAPTAMNGQLGYRMDAVGDVDGDGYEDLGVIGVPGSTEKYRLYLYYGSASAWGSYADQTLTGSTDDTEFALYFAGVGDVDADGYDDVALRAGSSSSSTTRRVYLYRGGASGLETTATSTVTGTTTADFGYVYGPGDYNGDGYGDVVVGAPSASSSYGQIYVYAGSSSGTLTLAATLTGAATSKQFGARVAAGSDVNGDGYDDLVVATSSPTVYLYKGASTGLGTTAASSFTGPHTSQVPYAVGDVTGDGYDDIVIGTATETGTYTSGGRARLYKGTSTGLASTVTTTMTGSSTSALLGSSVAGGNWNRDAYADVVVGAPGTSSSTGSANVYLGSASGLVSAKVLSGVSGQFGLKTAMLDADGDGDDELFVSAPTYAASTGAVLVYAGSSTITTTASQKLYAWRALKLGASVASAGDLDGDGYTDIALGAPGNASYTVPAAVYVYYGSADGAETDAGTTLTATSGVTNFGVLVAGVHDVNNDGYDDLAVVHGSTSSSVALYHGASSGVSTAAARTLSIGTAVTLAGAGDVDGDGYADVLVGAYGSSRAYVYKGSSTGVATSVTTTLTGSATTYGRAVAGVGDVNGDGYDDVAVGDYGYSSGRGGVFVYHGASTGLGTAVKTTLTGAATTSALGFSLGAAGDVNDDGYDDLVVGANSAFAAVYPGSSTGISTTGRTLGGTTGLSPIAAVVGGDFDGDGYSDVAIGAYHDRVLLYNGASSGITTTTSQTLTGTSGTSFSDALAAVPDIDGDGFDELLVGAPGTASSTGAAYLYVGTGDKDGDGYLSTVDCDDRDANAHPGGTEVCDAANQDEDCDGTRDDADTSVSTTGMIAYFVDADGDGYGAGSRTGPVSCDPTTGYAALDTDCDDTKATTHPAATEVCDAADVDEDCDGQADDDDTSTSSASKTSYYRDTDGDTYGGTLMGAACTVPSLYVATSGDCDDAVAVISPAATEVCDASDVDEDCDGVADNADASATGLTDFYRDDDGDGYGIATATPFCDLPSGYAAVDTDCDDTKATTNPGGTEICGGADEDCDGLTDDDDPSAADPGKTTYYTDADEDGYGATAARACVIRSGLAAISGDCDDDAASAHPGGSEVCDAADVDEDCDGVSDDEDPTAATSGMTRFYADEDGDGYGGLLTTTQCDAPEGYVATSSDCDDGDATISPAGTEVCDAADEDEDCDGDADDDDASVSTSSLKTLYVDADRDGFGSPTVTKSTCDASTGVVANDDDCDDGDAKIRPGAEEVVGDGVDGDCDKRDLCYEDADGDGYRTESTTKGSVSCTSAGEAAASVPAGDCHDGSTSVYPGATERIGDEVDQDCDGREVCYADLDNDGFRPDDGATVPSADASCRQTGEATDDAPDGDCDDERATFHPDADELCDEPYDYNCDGYTGDFDADGDGWAACNDCDDGDETRSPGTPETCNERDDDCDGTSDEESTDAPTWQRDGDGDGFTDAADEVTACDAPGGYIAPNPGDCSDADGQIYPGAADPDDDIDQDCDGVAGKEPKSCGCAPAGPAPGAVLGLLVATMVIRRRRA